MDEDASDLDLVHWCLVGRQGAWDKFFARFIPVMVKAIRHTLRGHSSGLKNFWDDEDVLWEIHEKLVVKFFRHGLLQKCKEPAGIRGWLVTVATNQTKDWLKEKCRFKESPRSYAERSMRSLDEPLCRDSKISLGDSIKDTADIYHLERHYVDEVLGALDMLRTGEKSTDRQKYWALRLSMQAVLPLSNNEITELSWFNSLPESVIREHLRSVDILLEQRTAQREARLGNAVLLWHKIRRLEGQLLGLERDCSGEHNVKVATLRKDLVAAMRQKEELLAEGRSLPRPSNRDIAQLLGIPPEQEGQVSTILKRARNALPDRDHGG